MFLCEDEPEEERESGKKKESGDRDDGEESGVKRDVICPSL